MSTPKAPITAAAGTDVVDKSSTFLAVGGSPDSTTAAHRQHAGGSMSNTLPRHQQRTPQMSSSSSSAYFPYENVADSSTGGDVDPLQLVDVSIPKSPPPAPIASNAWGVVATHIEVMPDDCSPFPWDNKLQQEFPTLGGGGGGRHRKSTGSGGGGGDFAQTIDAFNDHQQPKSKQYGSVLEEIRHRDRAPKPQVGGGGGSQRNRSVNPFNHVGNSTASASRNQQQPNYYANDRRLTSPKKSGASGKCEY